MERNGVRRLHGCSQLTSWVRVGMGKLMKICGNAATCIAFHRDESLGTLIYSTIFTILWSLYVPNSDDCNYRTKITVSTAQWSIYLPECGQYTYRTVMNIFTTLWSLYVPQSNHCKYRTVITIFTTVWSLHVTHNDHCKYRTVTTIFTAQWSLYIRAVTFLFTAHCSQ